MNDIAFLELKYGNIYGGYPNFFAIAEISLLVFKTDSNKIFLETWRNTSDVDYVSVYSKTNDLGHTIGKEKEVINMRSGVKKKYDEEFQLPDEQLQDTFYRLKGLKRSIRDFFFNKLRKYNVRDIVTFDGRRDVFLLEAMGVKFDRLNLMDVQKSLNKETDYLFSLNKLAIVISFKQDGSFIRSNNLEYWLHPIAANQVQLGGAPFDAVRLLMVYNEYTQFHDDFMMKAALLLNKIEASKE